MPHLLDWAALKPASAPNGVAKQAIDGVGATLVRVTVPAGLSVSRHSHDHEQFVHVVSGSGELETQEGKRAFGPGSVFHFPAGAWHAARFDTDTVLVETNLKV